MHQRSVHICATRRRALRAFTIIELLVVISIIGILSSVVLVSVQSARDRGRIAAGLRFEQHTRSALGDKIIASYDFSRCEVTYSGANPSGSRLPASEGSKFDLTSGVTTHCNFIGSSVPVGTGSSTRLVSLAGNHIIPTHASVDPFSDVTVSFWVNGSTATWNSSSPALTLQSSGATPVILNINFNGVTNGGITFGMIGSGTSGANFIPRSDVYDGKWHHVAFSVKGNTMTAFLDGRVYKTTNVTPISSRSDVLIMVARMQAPVQSPQPELLLFRPTIFGGAI